MVEETIKLKDGRKLGYSYIGDQNGFPVLYCSGGIGTRLQIQPVPPQKLPPNIRLIGTDRPGLGLSDFLPGRRILDWPNDVVQLIDHLQIKTFSVLGVSAGGPYALACAHQLPGRISKCGLVSTAVPPDTADRFTVMQAYNWFYRWMPGLTGILFWKLWGQYFGKTDEQIDAVLKKPPAAPSSFCETDRKAWTNAEYRRHGLMDHREAFRNGVRGPVYEAGLWGQPWGFRLEDVASCKVILWHGERDLNSPIKFARKMSAKIPRCEAHYFPEYGHSLGYYCWNEIISAIAN